MEEFIRPLVLQISILTEGAAALVIAVALIRSLGSFVFSYFGRGKGPLEIRFELGRSLTLTLEFLLAADILRTSVAPTWDEIGKLGAIVVLRTSLNFFLEREIRNFDNRRSNECKDKA